MKQSFTKILFSEIEQEFYKHKIDKEVIEPIYPGHLLYTIFVSMEGKTVFIGSKSEMEMYEEDIQSFFPHSTIFIRDEDDLTSASIKINSGNFRVMAINEKLLNSSIPAVDVLSIQKDKVYNRDHIIENIYNMGYERNEKTIKIGDFSIRGSIIDIFPLNSFQPVRFEFDNERLISIRLFNPFTQISTQRVKEVNIPSFYGKDTGITVLNEIKNYRIIARKDIGADNFYHLGTQGKDIPFDPMQNFNRNFDYLKDYLSKKQGKKIFIILETITEVERIKELLLDDFPKITYIEGHLSRGFSLRDIIIITESDIFGSSIPKKVHITFPNPLKDISTIEIGDYIVHEKFGIGVYEGLKKIRENNVEQEYITIRYAGNDRVYVPIYNMHFVSRYIGSKLPKVSSLKNHRWILKREKVREEIRNLAQEMLGLYAKRKALKGFAMLPDTEWQKEMEALFPYEETEDQIKTIQEIKDDMENETPMDRLLCGEVGYGKTEVALRAAFKAVMSNRQVIILAPTTILAEQHYNTFKERLSKFPIKVELLSRFTSRDAKQIIKGLKDGTVDILIGTHRILSPDIKFTNPGLLIIDEEQRFGVVQKEKIKKIKTNIDVLSMSATPIPRTLKLAMSNIIDLSLIETPPTGRLSVRTEIIHWDKHLIREIILREIDRGGQIYFVHNRIATIQSIAEKLKDIIPEARFGITHGRMKSSCIEKVMVDFIERKYDVLLTTAIIESGIDIPNVNTILIDNADEFGLSDLHQLRGRVGRTTRMGYCYLIVHNKVLKDEAKKRLYTIKHYSYLGAGFHIAIEDLNIRGAGNLFGEKQHGNVDAIGYDLYIKLLERTVKELKGEEVLTEKEIKMDIDAALTIPDTYMPSSDDRLYFYKKLSSVQTESELHNIEEEIEDRFGHLPELVEKLFLWIKIKLFAVRWNVEYLRYKDNEIKVEFSIPPKREEIKRLIKYIKQEIKFSHNKRFTFEISNISPTNIYTALKHIVS